jgi:regulator of sigma E protease
LKKQGFKKYDLLLRLEDRAVKSMKEFIETVNSSEGRPLTVLIERDGKKMKKTLKARKFHTKIADDIGLKLVITAHPTPLHQFVRVITLTYESLRGIFSGDNTLKLRHLSGPIGIFRGIGITYNQGGIMPVLSLIVLITYSLAILNIMPFPVLDGGHIVFALIEQVTGRPLPPKVVAPLFVIFIVLLISMMLYVTFYDTLRIMYARPKTLIYKYIPAPVEDVRTATEKIPAAEQRHSP